MRTALQSRSRAQVAVARSLPAPVGGWDTQNAVAAMPKDHAVILDNWIPRGSSIEVRRGFIEQCTGTLAPVETLISYQGSTDKIFAAAAAKIIDVTTAGSLASASYASAASARWNYTNFANDAGRFAILTNGAQAPIKYDGSAFTANAITGTSGSITLAPADLKFVMSHKFRLHFAEKARLRVWFLDINAIAGAAKLLDLGPIFSLGGSFAGMGRLTLDGGQGPDDYAVYVTTKGQVALFQGLDPSDSTSWALVGVWKIPNPVGERSVIQYGADLLVLTESGVFALSSILRVPPEEQGAKAMSYLIGPTFASSSKSYGSNFGWQPILYSGRGGLTIINVPMAELDSSIQYVRSNQGGGWCRFTGIDAFCWGTANGMIYFGSTAGVYQWDIGASDNGEFIVPDVLPAFQDFGNRTRTKVFTMVRALLRCPAIIAPALQILTDYDQATLPTAIQTVVAPGDISPDDSSLIRDDWTGAAGDGYVGSPRMRFAVQSTDDEDRLAVTADHTSLALIGPGGSDHILTRPNLPLDVEIQCVGFDVMFQVGGQL